MTRWFAAMIATTRRVGLLSARLIGWGLLGRRPTLVARAVQGYKARRWVAGIGVIGIWASLLGASLCGIRPTPSAVPGPTPGYGRMCGSWVSAKEGVKGDTHSTTWGQEGYRPHTQGDIEGDTVDTSMHTSNGVWGVVDFSSKIFTKLTCLGEFRFVAKIQNHNGVCHKASIATGQAQKVYHKASIAIGQYQEVSQRSQRNKQPTSMFKASPAQSGLISISTIKDRIRQKPTQSINESNQTDEPTRFRGRTPGEGLGQVSPHQRECPILSSNLVMMRSV